MNDFNTNLSTNASPLAALQKSGTMSVEPNPTVKASSTKSTLKEIVNGVKTITPIVKHLINQGAEQNDHAFPELMDSINLFSSKF